ncbi:MAG: GNAT family N-acetyltransferase [Clostridium sp.]
MYIHGKSRNELFADSAEINALYVLAGFQGEGIGRELLLEAMKNLKDMGYSSIIINCLQGNPAIEFYKKMGGSIVSKRVDTIKDVSIVEEVVYIKM